MKTARSSITRNIEKQMECNFITLELFPNIEPIPDCEALIDGKRYKTPGDVAQEMLRECRLWKSKTPDKDVMDIITPDWANYIKQNL